MSKPYSSRAFNFGVPDEPRGRVGMPLCMQQVFWLIARLLSLPSLSVDNWQLASDLDTKQTILQITAAGLCRTLTYFPWLNAGAKVVLFSLFSKFIAMFLDYIFISSQVPCKLGDHYRRSLGLLWAFCGSYVSNICASIIMLQKSSARKGFCAEDWRIWRVKWYIQHAGSAVFTRLPAWVCFFWKKFSRAEGCAEDFIWDCVSEFIVLWVCF